MFLQGNEVLGSLNIADVYSPLAIDWIYDALNVFGVNGGLWLEGGHFLEL